MVVFLVIFASGYNLEECDRLGSRKKGDAVNIKTAGWAAIAWPSEAGLCKALPRPEDAERDTEGAFFSL